MIASFVVRLKAIVSTVGRRERLSETGSPIVLQSVRVDQDKVNPYIPLLFQALNKHVGVRSFSWARAVLGRFDIFHVHWPEGLYVGSSRPATALKRALSVLLLIRLSVCGTSVVQTLHNVEPHFSGSRFDAVLRRWMDHRTVLWISLNRHTVAPRYGRSVVIPHGHYQEWYSVSSNTRYCKGRLLFFGILRPYKNVEALIAALEGVTNPEVHARVCGFPAESAYAEKLRSYAFRAPERVELLLRHLPDWELTQEIREAVLVVLPYQEMHNSGAMLLALSLGRPVLVPRSAITDDLADEVGVPWVLRYESELSSKIVEQSARAAALLLDSGSSPDLSGRDWDRIGELTACQMKALVSREES
jgi:glycosyltransferase involved in cell wall biosynthesis